MPPSQENAPVENWFSASASRKRFFDKKEETTGGRRKKRKISHHDDDLANELWDECDDPLSAIQRFSETMEKLEENKKQQIKPKTENQKDLEIVVENNKIDLLKESEQLKTLLKDCSYVKLPSKEEIEEKQKIRKRRNDRIKYDEVVRIKKTREQMPAHQCEMCQKVRKFILGKKYYLLSTNIIVSFMMPWMMT